VICPTVNPDCGNYRVRWLFGDKFRGQRFALTGDWTPVSQSTASCHGLELQRPRGCVSIVSYSTHSFRVITLFPHLRYFNVTSLLKSFQTGRCYSFSFLHTVVHSKQEAADSAFLIPTHLCSPTFCTPYFSPYFYNSLPYRSTRSFTLFSRYDIFHFTNKLEVISNTLLSFSFSSQ